MFFIGIDKATGEDSRQLHDIANRKRWLRLSCDEMIKQARWITVF